MAGESKLQSKCRDLANANRVLVRKVHAEGNRGWPDLELIFPINGETVRVEMKNPNGEGMLGELQRIEHRKIRSQGAIVYTCDSFEDFEIIIKRHLIC
jgi:hypothetical protein